MSRAGVEGAITRGTTNPNRLRRMDRYLIHTACPRIRATSAPVVVDLGFGASPVTTHELHQRLVRHVRDDVRVIGIDTDRSRVLEAREHGFGHLEFEHGGFEVPTPDPIVIRAANVLRQYPEEQVAAAWRRMASRLQPGGCLIEGTCDEIGRRAAFVTVNDQGVAETLTLALHVQDLDAPSDVAPRLPKALIHHNVPGEPVHELLNRLDRAWHAAASLSAFGARQRWLHTAEQVAQEWPVLDGPKRWRLGELTVPWSSVAPS